VRVAVTGCASDFGTVILPRLFDDPDVEEVVGIDIREPRVAHEKLRFENEDVRSPRLRELFDDCGAVVHLAFVVAEIHDKQLTHDVNINGSRNVIESAADAGARRIVIASSVSAYGVHADQTVLREDLFPRGNHDRYYFYDKAEVEHFVEWWLRRRGDDAPVVTLLRPCVICGPHFSNPLIDNLCAPVGLLPRGGFAFQLLHEDDLADAFHRAVREDLPGPYNVASEDEFGADELAEIHGQRLIRVPLRVARGATEVLFRLRLSPISSQWVIGHGEAFADPARLEEETGWRPRFTSRETAHVTLLQNGRPILRSKGELRRREVAEAALAPMTEWVRRWCDEVPGMREATGGADAFDEMLESAEHDFLPYKTGDVHLEVHAAEQGEPSIVFSPGLGAHARFYSPALGALRREGFDVIGVDRPGHGLSQGRRGDSTIDMTLDVLDGAIRYARERFGGPVALAGSSLGGIITWYALTREPDVDCAVCHNVMHPAERHEPAARVKFPLLTRLARIAPFAPVPIKQVADFDAVALDPRTRAYFDEEPDRIWCWTVTARTMASIVAFEPRLDWSRVEIPTLVLEGAADRMVNPEFTSRSFERSHPPGAELRELAGLGHLLFHDHLPHTLEHVAGFVRERVAAPAPSY
jgi:UDP-glucose 4-epimerase